MAWWNIGKVANFDPLEIFKPTVLWQMKNYKDRFVWNVFFSVLNVLTLD